MIQYKGGSFSINKDKERKLCDICDVKATMQKKIDSRDESIEQLINILRRHAPDYLNDSGLYDRYSCIMPKWRC
jgi:hypothetical protein